MTPGPPALVTMARRSPLARHGVDNSRAAANNCPTLPARTAPARSSAASNTSSAPARDPVWASAARAPGAWRPAFTTTTGFIRAAARKPLMKPRASATPSM